MATPLENSLQQLTSAIQCSLNPQGRQVQEAQSFIDQVKSLANGWSYFLELFTRCGNQQQDTAFVCLGCLCEIVANSVTTTSASTTITSTTAASTLVSPVSPSSPSTITSNNATPLRPIRDVLLRWLEMNLQQGTLPYQPPYLKTKVALLYVLLIKTEYPITWDQPFHFLFAMLTSSSSSSLSQQQSQQQSLSNGGQGASSSSSSSSSSSDQHPGALDFFFRVSRVLMEEVVSYDQSRTKNEITRNVEVKRAMRETGVFPKIVSVFVHVMSRGGSVSGSVGVGGGNGGDRALEEEALLVHCLETLQQWVSCS